MQELSADDLLHIWEWGQGRSRIHQALVILAAAHPEAQPEQLAQLSIGQRDAQLLTLRARTFGPQLQATTQCPKCTEALEYEIAVPDITVTPAIALPKITAPAELPPTHHWQQESYSIYFRLPTSADLLAVGDQPPEAAQKLLLTQCISSIEEDNRSLLPQDLPPATVQSLIAYIAEQDPQAAVELALSCGTCQHTWTQLFDIVSFFWQELTVAAQRLLQEIHAIATVYGWSEADILAMSPLRRSAYLNVIVS